uniref:Uncharacterized protein n=1 Tax=Clastoptera arizonana TaxID=38151 RepID=A0A1B6CT33_9HEMI
MASENEDTDPINQNLLHWSKRDRRENKKLRNSGLEYISRSGKTIAAKTQPDQLCNCPQKCGDRIPREVKDHLFANFYQIGDHVRQNLFLQSHIEMRSVQKRLWTEEKRIGGRLQRRVSCKYRVPIEIPKQSNIEQTNQLLLAALQTPQNEKLKPPKENETKTVEVCQKAFMNMYAITEKRVRLQREKLILKSRHEAEEKRIEAEEMQTSMSVARDLVAGARPLLINQSDNTLVESLPNHLLSSIDHDIAVVNNFFRHQLWKPEYIGFSRNLIANANNSAVTLID